MEEETVKHNGDPLLTPAQQTSVAIMQRIYAEWKWNVKKLSAPTWLDIATLIETAMRLCQTEIPDPRIRTEATERFRSVYQKVMNKALEEHRANTTVLFGEACKQCGHIFTGDEPKTWVADGEYLCAKCQ